MYLAGNTGLGFVRRLLNEGTIRRNVIEFRELRGMEGTQGLATVSCYHPKAWALGSNLEI